MEGESMSVKTAAQYLGVSAWTVYDMVRKSEIPHMRVRSRVLFQKNSLDKWRNSKELAAK